MYLFVRRHANALLLAFAPCAVTLHRLAPDRATLVFASSALAIVPLAGYIGRATETLARRLGGGIGGLLSATFGNVAELLIGAFALRHGLTALVKASITGSIIGNLLLVFGTSAFVGGLGRRVQRFNRTAASTGATMLLLSAVALIVPAVFHWLSRTAPDPPQRQLDLEIAIVLVVTYAMSLVFTLKTHRDAYGAGRAETQRRRPRARPEADRRLWRPIGILFAATAGVSYMAELLVNTISAGAQRLGMSELFIGVVIVALVGNAAEHFSAVKLARDDEMDAAVGIAIGSSTQIALFVAPVLVFLSYAIGPAPMDLHFTSFEVASVTIAVAVIAFIAHDGETHWMEGAQLLAVYVILALGFFFLPMGRTP